MPLAMTMVLMCQAHQTSTEMEGETYKYCLKHSKILSKFLLQYNYGDMRSPSTDPPLIDLKTERLPELCKEEDATLELTFLMTGN